MVIGQPPGAGIEILARSELHMLGDAAQLGIGVAAIQRPVPAAGTVVIFQDLHLIAGVAQLMAATMPAMPAPRIRTEAPFAAPDNLIGPVKSDCARIAHRDHRVVHHGAATRGADEVQERTAADGRLIVVRHG